MSFLLYILSIICILGLSFSCFYIFNQINFIVSIEIILAVVNVSFIFKSLTSDDLYGELCALVILVVAAAETAIGIFLMLLCDSCTSVIISTNKFLAGESFIQNHRMFRYSSDLDKKNNNYNLNRYNF